MAAYKGPVCPSFEDTLSVIKAAESNMSDYLSNFQTQIDGKNGVLSAEEHIFSSDGLGSISESEIPEAVIQLYERIFYSMLSPTFTDPEVFDPTGGKDYVTALEDGSMDPDTAALSAAKIALAQAVAIYNSANPS
tara:strand:+ start:6364 stop:6768 length:405 start_codon:yes stop_codon:yes gene_type:complete